MNNYPKWWNETITIFNKFEDLSTRQITWHKSVLTGCFWKNTNTNVLSDQRIFETDKIVCRVPKSDYYVDPETWDNMSAEERDEYFTLHIGDLVIQGEVDFELDEKVQGKRASDLLNKYRRYDRCFTVEKFVLNTGEFRGSEHYYIRGKGSK